MAEDISKILGDAMQDSPQDAPDPVEKVAAAIRNITASSSRSVTTSKIESGNTMLEALVYGDNDLVGLIAYAMHEVNRRDWCVAYENGNGRAPSDGELKAYLVGEQLERRLDTYRRLAEDSLAKIANPDQNMRRLIEAQPEAPRALTSSAGAASTSRTVAPLPAPVSSSMPAPTPAPMPASMARTFEMAPVEQSNVPQPKRGKVGRLIFWLLILGIAVAGIGYVLRAYLPSPMMPR